MPNLTVTRYAGTGIRIGGTVVYIRDADVNSDDVELWITSTDVALIYDGQMVYEGRQQGRSVRECKIVAPGSLYPDGEVDAASGECVIIDDEIILYVRWMEADSNVRFVVDAPLHYPIERVDNGREEWYREKRRGQRDPNKNSR